MAIDCSGRKVHCVEEAERYIFNFLCGYQKQSETVKRLKSHDYDLYLPWLSEIVINQPAEGEPDLIPATALDRLYMEAAWSLCQKGYLRPGPRKISSENTHDGYGKGFSLTFKGDEWIKSVQ